MRALAPAVALRGETSAKRGIRIITSRAYPLF